MVDSRVEKRNRPPISCNPCRTRKLRCNRQSPCDTCIKRGKADVCEYAANADRTKTGSTTKRVPVADQLRKLEDMITTLANQRAQDSQHSQDTSSVEDAPQLSPNGTDGLPSVSLGTGERSYTDSSHWLSILQDIKDIRVQLEPTQIPIRQSTDSPVLLTPHDDASNSPNSSIGTGLDFRRTAPRSLNEVLSALPSRAVCDFWIAHYFQSRFNVLPLILPSRFQEEYVTFWEQPAQTSPLWAALLFSMLALAAGTSKIPDLGDGQSSETPTVQQLATCTEQCLILGNYTEGGEYVMETLLQHLQSYYLRGKDAGRDLWFATGIVLRLAIRLGYHRDPSKQRSLAKLSPLKAEIRRRVWVVLYQMDALISFQMGLPSMIPTESCDTQLPMNLELTDFDIETGEPLTYRSLKDYTSATYSIVKQPVLEMFKKVVAHTQALKQPGYDETLNLDANLREAYMSLPSHMVARPIRNSLVDEPGIVMKRGTIEILFLKSIIILHRQHLAHGNNTTTSLSHQACVQAALQLLERQEEMFEATKPGGLLHQDRWLLTALNMGDMVFASVVICLDLTIRVANGPCACHFDSRTPTGHPVLNIDIELNAVKTAHAIWVLLGTQSAEARIVADALEATLQRVEQYQNGQPASLRPGDMQITPSDTVDSLPEVPFTGYPEIGADQFHWEFIDHWLLETDEAMPDLTSFVLNSM